MKSLTSHRFLLARIYLDSLVDQLTVNALETELRELAKPPSSGKDEGLQKKLHEAYHKSMEKIDHQRLGFRDLALQVLAWVTCAKRPLTASELQQALAVKSATKVDQGDLFRIEDMVSVCAGLVPSADDSGIIRLAHYTAHDYLRGDRHNWFPDAETKIMTACVNYLSFDAFEEGFCNTDKDFEARLSTYPFYDYAARNWGHHACAALGTDPCPDLILNFLENDTKVSASVQAMMVFARYTKFSQEVPEKMTGVHLAAYFGLLNAIQGLHGRGHELEAKDTWGRTPLSWAAQKGKTEVVKWLLANGAAPDSEATVPFLSGCTPLWFAVQNGHKGVTEVLLATKIDFDSAIAERQTPLARAARYGHEAVVQLLVEKGAKVDSKDVNGRTPLSLAAGNGHEGVVQYLLDHGANINLIDGHKRTPLSFAAENGREAVVQTLLSKTEVDASTEDQAGKTPLIYAQGNGFDHVVKRIQSFNSRSRHGVQE
jgi:ankyrin repeat protein